MNKKININIDKLDKKTQEVVKLTLELFAKDKQIKLDVVNFYYYLNKVEDYLWKNSTRNYYIHNISIESLSENVQVKENILKDCKTTIEMKCLEKERITKAAKKLNKLTTKQRRRYIMYYFYEMNLTQISKMEGVSINSVVRTLQLSAKKLNK